MSDGTTTRSMSGEIDLKAPPMEVGTQTADALLPIACSVSDRLTGIERVLMWNGFMAAVAGAMAGNIGNAATREILRSMNLCVDQMEAEVEARKGAH